MLFNYGSEAFYNLEEDRFETINLLNNSRLPLSSTNEEIKTLLVKRLKEIRPLVLLLEMLFY